MRAVGYDVKLFLFDGLGEIGFDRASEPVEELDFDGTGFYPPLDDTHGVCLDKKITLSELVERAFLCPKLSARCL